MKLHNVISTADLGQTVDARKFIKYNWGSYDVACYGGRCGYIKDIDMAGKVTVFMTGKIISTGCKSPHDSMSDLSKAKNLLVREGLIKQKMIHPKVRNMVATIDLGMQLDLNALADIPGCSLQRSFSPRLIYRMSGNCSCIIFKSGKIIIAGAKSLRELHKNKRIIYDRIGKSSIIAANVAVIR